MKKIRSVYIKTAAAILGSILFLTALVLLLNLICGNKKVLLPNVSPDMPDSSDNTAGNITDTDGELRGIWIATVQNINFPSREGLSEAKLKAELDDIVENVKKLGFNAIYFQVRPSADALYMSDIFPSSVYLSGKQEKCTANSFDALGYLLEAAHRDNIKVHAWINPLRVTAGSKLYPETDISALSPDNPARKNPDWVIPYADGKLYFDAGIPEVRELVAAGIEEIIRKYDVDGIIFDDYFYPYPETEETSDGKKAVIPFNDEETYKKYGGDFADLGDWRRDNINKLVKLCYDTVKKTNENCLFGIAPFGIWQNDNGSNGGSATGGMSSYSEIYCDPLAWIEGRYIDYIAPQIYWRFTTKVAPFDVLTRWWNAQLDGTGIDLYICHAAYNYDTWEDIGYEMKNQIEYARSELSYKGSILYGYAAIKNNSNGLADEIKKAFSDDIIYTDTVSNGNELMLSSPQNEAKLSTSQTYIIGSSDPYYPLLMDGKPISRTKSGYFSLYVKLAPGKNTFTFSQNGKEYKYVLYNVGESASTSENLGKYQIVDVFPSGNTIIGSDSVLNLKCTAPIGSTVTAKLGNMSVKLSPDKNVQKTDKYTAVTYSGTMVMPHTEASETTDLGTIKYSARHGFESASVVGGEVKVIGGEIKLPIEIKEKSAELKIAQDSWNYDDYSPQYVGMRDYATELSNGYYKLRMGGYVSAASVNPLPESTEINLAKISNFAISTDKKSTNIIFTSTEKVPMNAYVDGSAFTVELYNCDTEKLPSCDFCENPLFATAQMSAKQNVLIFKFPLIDTDNFYGYNFACDDAHIIVTLRNPTGFSDIPELPLMGKTIVLDAGHGGSDTGAIGPLGLGNSKINEADINLAITLAAKEKLTALGANVILTREEDTDLELSKRTEMLEDICPDLSISIHQNSMAYDADITRIRGLIGLYFADSGKLLTKAVSASVADALNRYEREPGQQRLAMARNPHFPSTLIECGFITCVEEYEDMTNVRKTEITASAIAEGVLDYYRIQSKWMLD